MSSESARASSLMLSFNQADAVGGVTWGWDTADQEAAICACSTGALAGF
jgi:hypothetical protein